MPDLSNGIILESETLKDLYFKSQKCEIEDLPELVFSAFHKKRNQPIFDELRNCTEVKEVILVDLDNLNKTLECLDLLIQLKKSGK